MLTPPGLTTPQPVSLPTGTRVEVRAAGVHWDAVCVPGPLAARVLAALDADTGGVICDPCNHRRYWLIRPGAADHWQLPAEARVRILGPGSWVGVPPRDAPEAAAAYWQRPPGEGHPRLTPPHSLHAALQVAITRAVRP